MFSGDGLVYGNIYASNRLKPVDLAWFRCKGNENLLESERDPSLVLVTSIHFKQYE